MFDRATAIAGGAPRVWSASWCAAEERAPYEATGAAGRRDEPEAPAGWPPPQRGLAGAVAALERRVDELAGVDLDREVGTELLEAVARLQEAVNRVTAQQVRVLDAVERRQAYREEGAVSAASWLRERVRMDHHQAVRRVEAARRLDRLPRLGEAFARGAVTFEHVAAITSAAVPRRMEAVARCEEPLVGLALAKLPRDVRRAVARVRELADPDGTGAPPLDEHGLDERRDLEVSRGVDGLVTGRFTLDQAQGELLLTAVDAYERPDPAGTPVLRRRTAGQRRADALSAALRALLDSGSAPRVQGNKPHLVLTVDLETLLGAPEARPFAAARGGGGSRGAPRPAPPAWTLQGPEILAGLGVAPASSTAGTGIEGHSAGWDGRRAPRLRHTGELDAERARRIANEAKVQVVLTMGPWRVTNVGRWQRRLPAWLRMALELVHRHCRGPSCTRPISWTEAHHVTAWYAERGETDLNRMAPVCVAHHAMLTTGGWRMDFEPGTGVCTWTGPDGQVVRTLPPEP